MDAFTTLTGIVAPLDRVNVDTDQIIPKQYLKTIKRTGLREGLFSDWRLRQRGQSPGRLCPQSTALRRSEYSLGTG